MADNNLAQNQQTLSPEKDQNDEQFNEDEDLEYEYEEEEDDDEYEEEDDNQIEQPQQDILVKEQAKAVESWEILANDNVQIQSQIPEKQPEQQPTQQPATTEEKPKKKMMKLNPNAVAFVPGGGAGSSNSFSTSQPQPYQTNFAAPFQPGSQQFPGNQPPFDFYGNRPFQPQYMPGPGGPGGFGGPYGPGGFQQYAPQGNQPPWQFNQDFPLYPGGPMNYVQPDMTFNNNMGFASFNRKNNPAQTGEEELEEGENQTIDREKLNQMGNVSKKKKKVADPNKTKEQNKVPREYKRLAKKDDQKQAAPKKKAPKIEDEGDNSKFTEVDESRAPVNIVFIGHVDAGKSTICGEILLLTGRVDKNELRKLEIEAKEKKRESWYLAYIMDINEEERAKGKTVEVGKAHFTTKSKRFTILDAPGHKNYVPNMIAGASQADYAALVISAKTGEFESGFEKGGQTREHAMLAKSLGVLKMIVVVNKMDEDSWSQARFNFIKDQLSPFLANSCGFDLEKDVSWIPISGLLGHNMAEPVSKEICNWYTGPTFFDQVDSLPVPERNANGALRVPVLDKMRDIGLHIFGKVESGTLYTDMTVTLMPFKKEFQISHIFNTEDQRVKYAKPGENVRLKVKNIEDTDIKRGFMICLNDNLCPVCFEFEAKITILELPEHKPLFSQGYKAIIHMHTIVEEIEVNQVMAAIDKEKDRQIKSHYLKNGMTGLVRLQCVSYMCIEKVDTNPHLGRFTLRDEGRTIALGDVLKVKVVKGVVNTVPVNIVVPGSEKKIEKVEENKTEEVAVSKVEEEEKKEVEIVEKKD